jgi:NAD(P)-dependent dehydrogenase (short-subunit alcohol dehydrogenase family)
LGHYVAAKHGVIGLVKTLAIELSLSDERECRLPDNR